MLGRVIRALETEDPELSDPPEPERVLRLLRVHHAALVDLLAHGPLICEEALAREHEVMARARSLIQGIRPGPELSMTDTSILRAELLQLLGSTVRGASYGAASSAIWLISSQRAPIGFTARLVDGRAVIAATGDTRSLVVLQTLLLLQEVGLPNVQKCSAPDCRRLFVKVYRREFCSAQCQKRIYTRTKRRLDRERKEYLARRRRQRRKKGA